MFMNKKGVSPIIAAILLVVITIAIGATTMAFIRGLSDDNIASAKAKSSQIKCGTDVNLEVISVNNNYKICKNPIISGVGSLEVTLKNKGFVDIKSFKLTVLGDGAIGAQENITVKALSTNSIDRINLTFTNSSDLGANIESYVLEPVIQGDPGQDIYCSDVTLNWNAEDISTC